MRFAQIATPLQRRVELQLLRRGHTESCSCYTIELQLLRRCEKGVAVATPLRKEELQLLRRCAPPLRCAQPTHDAFVVGQPLQSAEATGRLRPPSAQR